MKLPIVSFHKLSVGWWGKLCLAKIKLRSVISSVKKNVFNLKKIKGGQDLPTIILKTPAGEFSPFLFSFRSYL